MTTMRVRAEMPGDPPRKPKRGPGWTLGITVLVLLAARSVYKLLTIARVPSGYMGRHWDAARNGEWPYPTEEVRWILTVIGLDLLVGVFLFALRSKTTLPVRALAFGFLNVFGFLLMVPMAMHASGTFSAFLGWLLLAAGWGILFAMFARIIAGFRNPI